MIIKMVKIILLCGKICSGKSYYADHLKLKTDAVILSCDEIMFDLGLDYFEDAHNSLVPKIKRYFYKKASEIVSAGTNVILDFGFWSKAERSAVSQLFKEWDISFEWHYIDIPDEDWVINIAERNKGVCENGNGAYFVDEGLMQKLIDSFDKPAKDEIDVWVTNKRKEELS